MSDLEGLLHPLLWLWAYLQGHMHGLPPVQGQAHQLLLLGPSTSVSGALIDQGRDLLCHL